MAAPELIGFRYRPGDPIPPAFLDSRRRQAFIHLTPTGFAWPVDKIPITWALSVLIEGQGRRPTEYRHGDLTKVFDRADTVLVVSEGDAILYGQHVRGTAGRQSAAVVKAIDDAFAGGKNLLLIRCNPISFSEWAAIARFNSSTPDVRVWGPEPVGPDHAVQGAA